MSVIIFPGFILSPSEDALAGDHPVLLYQNIFRDPSAVITVSGETPGNVVANAIDGLTWDFWQPAGLPAWVELNAGESKEIDALGITFDSVGPRDLTVLLESSPDGVVWSTVAEFITSSRVALALFAPTTAQYWAVSFYGSGDLPFIADITLGAALRFQRRLYGGHVPDRFAAVTQFSVNRSRNGQRLGATIVREGLKNNVSIKNLTADWVRDSLAPALEHMRGGLPFYWAWRPQTFPLEVAFGWTMEDVRPSNNGTRNLLDVNFNYEGIGPSTIDGPQESSS
jgi:hypothetical protein